MKSEFKTENYVSTHLSRRHRSAYAKFRAGIAPLSLETGRYDQLSIEQGVCFHCEDVIESEEHVLTQCSLYSDLRRTLYIEI